MREFGQLAVAGPPAQGSLIDHLTERVDRAPRDVALRVKRFDRWVPVSVSALYDEIRMIAKGIAASGVQPGDRVGVMAGSCHEWPLVAYAIWHAGGVSVPIDARACGDEVEWILSDSGAAALFLGGPRQRQVFAGVAASLPQVRAVWHFDDDWVYALAESGDFVGDDDLDARWATVNSQSPATIVYNCADHGPVPGCTLTHGNLMTEVEALTAALPEVFAEDRSALLFLPLAQTFGLIVSLACFRSGVVLGYCADESQLADDLATFGPTFLPTVPPILESLFNDARTAARAAGSGALFDLAAACAAAYSRSLDDRGPDASLRLRRAVYDRLVFGRVREALGGHVTHVLAGSAATGERLGHFFRGIGIPVLDTYGCAETSWVATANAVRSVRIGSAGLPLPGTGVRITRDRGIQINGPQVFSGYWNNEVATKEVLDPDGWLTTGYSGDIDADGYLWITGRKSELIATAERENIAPAPLEDRVRSHFLVSRCMVLGEGRAFLGALVTIDPRAYRVWLANSRLPEGLPLADAASSPALRQEIQTAIAAANRAAVPGEAIGAFAILPADFSVERGELSPSLALRRAAIRERYAEAIEALYA